MPDFDPVVTPHSHSAFSLDSASPPDIFLKRHLELGTGYFTCTDHGTLSGTRKVYDLANKAKITPILGCELYFRPTHCDILEAGGIHKTVNEKFKHLGATYIDYSKYQHATVHFLDLEAFQTASVLLSKADDTAERHGSERKPIFGWEQMEELCSKNVTLFSGCLIGIVQRHLMENRPDLAVKYYERFRSIVKPGNWGVEIFPHKCDTNYSEAVYLVSLDGKEQSYHPRKKLKVKDSKGKYHDLDGYALNKKFSSGPLDYTLVGHYRRTVLTDIEPYHFTGVRLVEGFIPNECTDFAPDGAVQLACNRFVLDLACKHGDPVYVSDDSHLATADYKVAQDVRLSQSGSWRFSEVYSLKSSQECYDFFSTNMGTTKDEFKSWVQNSRDWAARFKDFKFKDVKSLPSQYYPADTVTHLLSLIKQHGRMDWQDKIRVDRLKTEIKLFQKNGVKDFLPYFFTQEDVLGEYERQGRLVAPGRGSSGGVLIAYLLGITQVDPFKYDLSLDRFLTLDRIKSNKWPDIDVDLGTRDILDDKEDGTPGYLTKRFGKEHVAKVATSGTLRLKSAIKDVYRAMNGEVTKEIHLLTKRMGDAPQGQDDSKFVFGYVADGSWVKGAIDTDPALKEFIAIYPKEWDAVQKCLSLRKSTGIHAGAYVITDKDTPVTSFLPTCNIDGTTVTQWTKDEVESAGGVKMDYLVISILNDIEGCIKLIQNNDPKYRQESTVNGLKYPGFRMVPFEGKDYDVWGLPELDPVFRDILEAKTETVFQLDTDSAKRYLRLFDFTKPNGKMGINNIADMSIFTALDRPGTLDATVSDGSITRNMLEEYVARAKGERPIGLIQAVNDVCPDTQGVLVYQEIASKVFKTIGGTTGPEAEGFREHTSKKQLDKVLKDKTIFMAGAIGNVGQEIADKIWDQLVTSARYGFCIDGDQLITTSGGVKKMSEVAVTDEVAYYDCDSNSVKYEHPANCWLSGNKEVYEVELEDGTTIRGTEDHRFLYEGEWHQLKDLVFGIQEITIYTKRLMCLKNLKIKSFKSLGVRPVYDMEMPTKHNFVLDNGVVAHNCLSHGIEYSVISYACAFLKHYYPLQWWCAVLANSNRNEIKEKFWIHCGKMVLLPDVRYSKGTFSIENDKIRAPLWLLEGVGETANAELALLPPSTTIEELVNNIDQLAIARADKGTPEVPTEPQPEPKQADLFVEVAPEGPLKGRKRPKARSAITRKVIYSLIMSGTADGLFGPQTDVYTKLQSYESARAVVNKTKVQPIDPKYLGYDAISRFQLRKQLMPFWSESLLKTFIDQKVPGITRDPDRNLHVWGGMYPFVTIKYLKALNDLAVMPNKNTVAMAAYVLETRVFNYHGHKEACEVLLDVNGEQMRFVKWGDFRTGKLESIFKSSLTSALVVAIICKSKAGKDPSIEALHVIKDPPDTEKDR